jgi:hypothetical protein
LHSSRAADLFRIYQTAFFAYVGLIAVTAATSEAALAVAAAAIGVAIVGILVADAAMKDLSNLRASMDDGMRNSAYGQGYASTPYPAFPALTAIIHVVIAASILLSL